MYHMRAHQGCPAIVGILIGKDELRGTIGRFPAKIPRSSLDSVAIQRYLLYVTRIHRVSDKSSYELNIMTNITYCTLTIWVGTDRHTPVVKIMAREIKGPIPDPPPYTDANKAGEDRKREETLNKKG